jgi:catechol 2,3-dioxygenase-like lactoylglutathione lyase family enzyme
MKPRVTLITLGVDDLEKSLTFYQDGLGSQPPGKMGREIEHGAVAFFDLQPGLKLAIWERANIAHAVNMAQTAPSPTDFTLAHTVRRKEAIDEVMRLAEEAGARMVKSAGATFYGGYAGYFQDPDGRLWEVAGIPNSCQRSSASR